MACVKPQFAWKHESHPKPLSAVSLRPDRGRPPPTRPRPSPPSPAVPSSPTRSGRFQPGFNLPERVLNPNNHHKQRS
eukprot:1880589-Prymnesium_polylepis.1